MPQRAHDPSRGCVCAAIIVYAARGIYEDRSVLRATLQSRYPGPQCTYLATTRLTAHHKAHGATRTSQRDPPSEIRAAHSSSVHGRAGREHAAAPSKYGNTTRPRLSHGWSLRQLNTAVGRKALVSAGDPDVHVPEHAVVAMAPSGTMPRAAAARAAHQISATSAAANLETQRLALLGQLDRDDYGDRTAAPARRWHVLCEVRARRGVSTSLAPPRRRLVSACDGTSYATRIRKTRFQNTARALSQGVCWNTFTYTLLSQHIKQGSKTRYGH